ncbi:MAG TPA: S41 family peptidase, partial [Aggregatilineales bacterium]|nr:S41 family peptidase [Aggregatilineales bacterium]
AYVIDLRHNGGGLVNAAVDVVSEFLDGGVVLYETRQGGEERTFSASRGGAATEEPLVVLVNRGTASASEIVAGALQDRERAVLVGEQTFGKGSVQLILTLSDSSSLHVTTAEWYTPNRHRLQDQGLTPDIPVESDEDGQAALSAALEYLNSELAVAEVSDGAR